MVSFRCVPEPRPRGGISIPLPFDPVETWGDRLTFHLTGSVGGCPIRGAVSPARGEDDLRLGPTWVRDAHLDLSAPVDVVLKLEGPQFADLAADLRAAIGAGTKASRFFDEMPTTYREGYVRWVEEAKRPETRLRRIEATAAALAAGKRQRD